MLYSLFFFNVEAKPTRPMMFQDPATAIMEGIIDLHHYVFFYLFLVTFFVLSLILHVLYYFSLTKFTAKTRAHRGWFPLTIRHDALIEIIWTMMPACILVLIGLPSFVILYAIDEIHNPSVTFKAIGHQWYWHYEYSELLFGNKPVNFASRMLTATDLVEWNLHGRGKFFRLLETTKPVILPEKLNIRLLTTSNDVLHSWAVPSFGIKIDACPGRLNEVGFQVKRVGTFYGQCSEICGVNHGFMPISVVVLPISYYLPWITIRSADHAAV